MKSICYNNSYTNFIDNNNYGNKIDTLYSLDTDNKLHIKLIPGVLKLSSKNFNTCLNSKKKNKIFIMKEFEPAFSLLPKFMIKTSKITIKQDMFVIANIIFENNKLTGNVFEYIGYVGNIESEKILCQKISTIYYSNKVNRIDKYKLGYTDIDLTPNRIDLTDLYTISVDPPNTKDIDDAISLVNNNNIYELYIHISDPTSYFNENTLLEEEISKRTETIYLSNKIYNMFPNDLTDIFSLHQDRTSRAYTIYFKINSKVEIIECKAIKSIININKNTTYDEFEKNKSKENYKDIYDLGYKLHNIYFKNGSDYSSKKMIETYMVLTNLFVSKKIIKSQKKAIIRCQSNKSGKFINTDNNEYQELYNRLQLDNAITKLHDYKNPNNSFHSSLNIDTYTYFTSPIRRYTDILVHRMLYNITDNRFTINTLNNNNYIHQIFTINHNSKYYRKIQKLEKDISLTQTIIKEIGEPNDRIINVKGIILDINDNKNIKYIRVKCLSLDEDNEYFKNIINSISKYIIDNVYNIKINTEINKDINYNIFDIIDFKLCFLSRDIRKIKAYL